MKHIHDSDHLQERRLEFGSQCSLKLNPILDSGLSFETSAKDESIEPSESSWHPFRGSMFHVRKGPNYDKSKQKAPSDESLYQPVHCFAFRSERRTSLIDSLPVPHDIAFPGGNIPDLLDERVPHLFVVQYQIPTEQPKLMKSSHDGKGGQIALYFVPSKRFCLESNALFQNDQNSNLQCSNAAKLFTEWCGQCDVSKTWKSRFKCIAKVRHVDSDSGSFLNRFNGKPMLVKETSSARRYVTNEGIRIIEYTVNMHKWAYIPKKGIVSLLPKLKEMTIDLGFTIEARDDNEMPECILASITLDKINPKEVKIIPSELHVDC